MAQTQTTLAEGHMDVRDDVLYSLHEELRWHRSVLNVASRFYNRLLHDYMRRERSERWGLVTAVCLTNYVVALFVTAPKQEPLMHDCANGFCLASFCCGLGNSIPDIFCGGHCGAFSAMPT